MISLSHPSAPPRAYIATGYDNQVSYAAARDLLVQYGFEITFDWTLAIPPPVHQRVDRDLFMGWAAGKELAAIRDADLVLVILPGGTGTHAELGMALALGKWVIVLADTSAFGVPRKPNGDPVCVFYSLAQTVTEKWHEVERSLRRLLELRRQIRG